jgi:hypothetical protein
MPVEGEVSRNQCHRKKYTVSRYKNGTQGYKIGTVLKVTRSERYTEPALMHLLYETGWSMVTLRTPRARDSAREQRPRKRTTTSRTPRRCSMQADRPGGAPMRITGPEIACTVRQRLLNRGKTHACLNNRMRYGPGLSLPRFCRACKRASVAPKLPAWRLMKMQ